MLSEPTKQIIDRLQGQIDLYERVVRDIDEIESRWTQLRRELANSASRSGQNRDQSLRDWYLSGAFTLWCAAQPAWAPPNEGRWKQRGAAIAFLTTAGKPVVGNLGETAIRNWVSNHVAQLRRISDVGRI